MLKAGMSTFKEDNYLKRKLVASEDPDSGDGAIIIIAEEADGGKGVFLQLLNTLEHSRDEIAAHEHFTQLVVVLVLAQPD